MHGSPILQVCGAYQVIGRHRLAGTKNAMGGWARPVDLDGEASDLVARLKQLDPGLRPEGACWDFPRRGSGS
ncbi:MAG: hypothetical protein CMJ89_19605 [Planctomycetes bacterium]|nr:hypothetical protein [Planctomycetota bacterium]